METHKTVSMAVVDPGTATSTGEFKFSMQPRFSTTGRTIAYELTPADAEALRKAIVAFLAGAVTAG